MAPCPRFVFVSGKLNCLWTFLTFFPLLLGFRLSLGGWGLCARTEWKVERHNFTNIAPWNILYFFSISGPVWVPAQFLEGIRTALEAKIYYPERRRVKEIPKEGAKMRKLSKLKFGETFSFLGFYFKRMKTKQGKIGIQKVARMKARTSLLRKLRGIFGRHISQSVDRVTYLINPILRGWVNYFRISNDALCFGYMRDWVEKKVRRHPHYLAVHRF